MKKRKIEEEIEMKITKREFVNALENREHIFIGASRKPAKIEDLLRLKAEIFEAINNGRALTTRKIAEKRQSYLRFTDDSRLYFDTIDKREYFEIEGVLEVQKTEIGCTEPYRYIYYLPLD